uniref:Putative 7.8 kDa protein in ral-gp17 intergenic region n=1 Tax=Lygus hesperus TaxID=30085 RepID=A0A0A9WM90_LYGHE
MYHCLSQPEPNMQIRAYKAYKSTIKGCGKSDSKVVPCKERQPDHPITFSFCGLYTTTKPTLRPNNSHGNSALVIQVSQMQAISLDVSRYPVFEGKNLQLEAYFDDLLTTFVETEST